MCLLEIYPFSQKNDAKYFFQPLNEKRAIFKLT
jgi:hypothetical protein